MGLIFIALYVFFCLLVAYAGRKTRVGFFGVLALSIFITPLATAVLVVLFQPRRRSKKSS